MQTNLGCLLQAVVLQGVKLPGVSRLEGQPLEAPAAAADPTPEAPLASGAILPSHPCPVAPLSLLYQVAAAFAAAAADIESVCLDLTYTNPCSHT